VGAIAKGAAESVGAKPLMDFEMGGNLDLLAMRDAWSRDYISHDDKMWCFGSTFLHTHRFGDQIIIEPQPDIRNADLKDFFLRIMMAPTASASSTRARAESMSFSPAISAPLQDFLYTSPGIVEHVIRSK